jgi:predicted metalloprotease
VSDNQWRPPPGQQPQQPPQYGQGQPPYGPQYGQNPPAQYGQPQYGQVPQPGPFAPQQPWQPGQPGQFGGGMPPAQGLPHGIGWGAPQPGGPQPPKKKSGGKIALLVAGLAVLGVVALVFVSNLLKHNGDPYSSPSPTIPTYSSTSEPSESPSVAPSPTQPASSQPTTTKPVVKPTAPRTTTTTKTPPKGPTDAQLVINNSLYRAGGMASVNCKESNARPATAAGARANYAKLRACLGLAWRPLVRKSGNTFRQPSVVTFTGSVNSPCGTWYDSGPPFYCGSNETIYMNLTEDLGNYNRYPQSYQKVWARMWMLHQFAHEYGHHVQNLTGIFQANHNLRYEAPTQAKELEGSRRLELQASCFSDIFIGSNKRSYPVTGQALFQWKWLIGHTTDLKNDHGDAGNHQYWAKRGFTSRNARVCNTFVAPGSRVQ